MPISSQISLIGSQYVIAFSKAAILIILVFYAIFALVIVRQVDLMNKTLTTNLASVIKAIAIIHAGFAIGFIILAFGML